LVQRVSRSFNSIREPIDFAAMVGSNFGKTSTAEHFEELPRLGGLNSRMARKRLQGHPFVVDAVKVAYNPEMKLKLSEAVQMSCVAFRLMAEREL
jgi:hypothetical protein